MRVLGCIALMVAVGLAGCAEDAAQPQASGDDTSFDDVKVQVSDTTGAILGVVVNEAVLPVQGAAVKLLNTEHETVSDEAGRFSFSDIPAGTYFLDVSKELHVATQSSVDVVAGVEKPAITKIQLTRLYQGEPFMVTIPNSGFFTCSQANMPPYWYSSSSCHDTYWVDGSDLGVELDQQRTFHSDVAAGWQTQIFEMTWSPSSYGSSERMGIVVSTEKETRAGSHWFMNFDGSSPLTGRMDCNESNGACETHPTAASTEPTSIPPEGWTDMSYFMSVRPPADAVCAIWCAPPGLAFDQDFEVWLTQFYYAAAPEDWSFINGSPNPF